jgi:hypothetical protein
VKQLDGDSENFVGREGSPDLLLNPDDEEIFTEMEVTYVAQLIKKKAPTYSSPAVLP